MKALVFAAGLGTRLKPLTDSIPKALVSVDGVPMLQRVLLKLKASGFSRIVVNTHHFADKVAAFLEENGYTYPALMDEQGGTAGSYYITAFPICPVEIISVN